MRRKIDYSDRQLDSITFETFGWALSQNDDGFRRWRSNDASLAEKFFDAPPDFGTWDSDEIRAAMMELQGLAESATFRLEDVPDHLQKYVPTEFPDQVSLLEFDLFEIPPAKCILTMTRHRAHGDVHYAVGVMILFAACFWILGIEVEEGAVVGEREGAVARLLLEGTTTAEAPLDEFDPYDRQWDGIVPLEDDPLTRMRLLAARLRDSIKLRGDLAELEPYAPTDG